MLHRISEGLLTIINFFPALFVAEDSPHFMIIRAMFALLLVVLVVAAFIVLRHLYDAVARLVSKRPT
jgi:uncharacterized membrane protein